MTKTCRSCGLYCATKYCGACGAKRYASHVDCHACGVSVADVVATTVVVIVDERGCGRTDRTRRYFCAACGSAAGAKVADAVRANPWEV